MSYYYRGSSKSTITKKYAQVKDDNFDIETCHSSIELFQDTFHLVSACTCSVTI